MMNAELSLTQKVRNSAKNMAQLAEEIRKRPLAASALSIATVAVIAVAAWSMAQNLPEATTVQPVVLPIMKNGVEIGITTLPAGTKVQVKENREGRSLITTTLAQGWVEDWELGVGEKQPDDRVGTTNNLPKETLIPIMENGRFKKYEKVPKGTSIEIVKEHPTGAIAFVHKGKMVWLNKNWDRTIDPESFQKEQFVMTPRGRAPVTVENGMDWAPEEIWEDMKTGEGKAKGIRQREDCMIAAEVSMKLINSKTVISRSWGDIPQEFSLRPEMEKAGIVAYHQQGGLDSCSLAVIRTLLQFEAFKNGHKFVPSLAHLNWVEGGGAGREKGASPQKTLRNLGKLGGVLEEKSFPTSEIGKAPPAGAALFPIAFEVLPIGRWVIDFTISPKEFGWTSNELRDRLIIEELLNGRLVALAGSFAPGPDAHLNANKGQRNPHIVVVTGFKMTPQGLVFEILNSWGQHWGDKGYGTLEGGEPQADVFSIRFNGQVQ